jgi:hypothetical protein
MYTLKDELGGNSLRTLRFFARFASCSWIFRTQSTLRIRKGRKEKASLHYYLKQLLSFNS